LDVCIKSVYGDQTVCGQTADFILNKSFAISALEKLNNECLESSFSNGTLFSGVSVT
jgi:hypothetical protein